MLAIATLVAHTARNRNRTFPQGAPMHLGADIATVLEILLIVVAVGLAIPFLKKK